MCKGRERLHLRLTIPVALTALRRELARVIPRSLNGLELAGSAQPNELTLGSSLVVSGILHCGLASAFPPEIVHIPALVVIGSVAPFRTLGPAVVLLHNSACPRIAIIRI